MGAALLLVAAWLGVLGLMGEPQAAPPTPAGARSIAEPEAVELEAPSLDRLARIEEPAVESEPLAFLDAVLLDRTRHEPVPFAEVAVVDIHGVVVEARSNAEGRVFSSSLLAKGRVAVHMTGGPSRPHWRRKKTGALETHSLEELCVFGGVHGGSSEWADVWEVDSARLVPLALEGVPELRPAIDLCAYRPMRHPIIEIASFSDPSLDVWRGATHVVSLSSRTKVPVRTPDRVPRLLLEPVFGGLPWTAEAARTSDTLSVALLTTQTPDHLWAGALRTKVFPLVGEEPLRATLAPVGTTSFQVLAKRYGERLGLMLQERATAFYRDVSPESR